MSADGKHELTMATNFIGHCILNESLMGLVAAAGRELKFEPEGQNYARIIVVSSVVVFIFNDLHKLKNFDLDGSAAIKAGTFDTHKQVSGHTFSFFPLLLRMSLLYFYNMTLFSPAEQKFWFRQD